MHVPTALIRGQTIHGAERRLHIPGLHKSSLGSEVLIFGGHTITNPIFLYIKLNQTEFIGGRSNHNLPVYSERNAHDLPDTCLVPI